MKIKHFDREFELDVEKAIKAGAMKPIHTFRVGDVFRGKSHCAVALYQVFFGDESSYVLLGLGCASNSGKFFTKLHTLEEIKDYISERELFYCGNVNDQIYQIVADSTSP